VQPQKFKFGYTADFGQIRPTPQQTEQYSRKRGLGLVLLSSILMWLRYQQLLYY